MYRYSYNLLSGMQAILDYYAKKEVSLSDRIGMILYEKELVNFSTDIQFKRVEKFRERIYEIDEIYSVAVESNIYKDETEGTNSIYGVLFGLAIGAYNSFEEETELVPSEEENFN